MTPIERLAESGVSESTIEALAEAGFGSVEDLDTVPRREGADGAEAFGMIAGVSAEQAAELAEVVTLSDLSGASADPVSSETAADDANSQVAGAPAVGAVHSYVVSVAGPGRLPPLRIDAASPLTRAECRLRFLDEHGIIAVGGLNRLDVECVSGEFAD